MGKSEPMVIAVGTTYNSSERLIFILFSFFISETLFLSPFPFKTFFALLIS
jgi:hypothetical protein